jgi:hypothetical protein
MNAASETQTPPQTDPTDGNPKSWLSRLGPGLITGASDDDRCREAAKIGRVPHPVVRQRRATRAFRAGVEPGGGIMAIRFEVPACCEACESW